MNRNNFIKLKHYRNNNSIINLIYNILFYIFLEDVIKNFSIVEIWLLIIRF